MKRNLLTVFLLITVISVKAQWYKNWDMEAAINYSKVQNKFEFSTNRYYIGTDGFEDQIIFEKPGKFINFNISVGWKVSTVHRFSIKYGHNNIGMEIIGNKTIYKDGGVLIQTYYFEKINKVNIWAAGIQYEFAHSFDKDNFLFAIGLDRQMNDYSNVFIPFESLGSKSFAAYFSLGYQKYLSKYSSIIGRVFNHNTFPTDKLFYNYGSDLLSNFSPYQYGIEIAFRKSFYSKSK